MSDNIADEYMGNARACIEVAERMSLREDRERMVQMAKHGFNWRGRRWRGRRSSYLFLRATLIGPNG